MAVKECVNDIELRAAIGNAGDSLILVEFYATWTDPSVVISQEL